MSDERPVTYEEAVVLAYEIGQSLGGRQQRALEVLTRFAARGRRTSSAVVDAAQHFAAARVELDEGLRISAQVAHDLRELQEADPEKKR